MVNVVSCKPSKPLIESENIEPEKKREAIGSRNGNAYEMERSTRVIFACFCFVCLVVRNRSIDLLFCRLYFVCFLFFMFVRTFYL